MWREDFASFAAESGGMKKNVAGRGNHAGAFLERADWCLPSKRTQNGIGTLRSTLQVGGGGGVGGGGSVMTYYSGEKGPNKKDGVRPAGGARRRSCRSDAEKYWFNFAGERKGHPGDRGEAECIERQ